jgi:hypothetical protein
MGFIYFLAGMATEFGHTYGHWISHLFKPGQEFARYLPVITNFPIPVLDGNEHLFYIYFGTLFLLPLCLCIWAWFIKDRLFLTEFVLYGYGIYLGVFIISIFFIAIALWAPFSLL